jgi:hypothetical protein
MHSINTSTMIKLQKKNSIAKVLRKYNVDFVEVDGRISITSDMNLNSIPSEKIIKMLGLKKDKGHLHLLNKLNGIEKSWLYIFLKYYTYHEVYDNNGEIIKSNFYIFIYEILDGLE